MTLREVVAITALSQLLREDPSGLTKRHACAMVIHLAALRLTSLSERRCGSATTRDSGTAAPVDDKFLRQFSEVARGVVEGLEDNRSAAALTWDVFDLVDGRVFWSIFSQLPSIKLPQRVLKFSQILEAFVMKEGGCVEDGSWLGRVVVTDAPSETPQDESPKVLKSSVLPFSHPALDEYLGTVKVELDNEPPPVSAETRIFDEVTHWHNSKKVLDNTRKPAAKVGFWAHKRTQRWMAHIIAYAASLTNSSGKNIDPEIIVIAGGAKNLGNSGPAKKETTAPPKKEINSGPAKKDPKAGPAAKGKKVAAKVGGRENALAAAKAVKEQKTAVKATSTIEFWRESCHELEKEPGLEKRYLKSFKFLSGRPNEQLVVIGTEGMLYLCNILIQVWSRFCKDGAKTKGKRISFHYQASS